MAGGATRNARKTRKRKNSDDSTSAATSRTLKQYSVDEKLEIIAFAKGNGNRAAGREYNVAESSIREWRKNEEKLRAANIVESERQRISLQRGRNSAEQSENNAHEKVIEVTQESLGSSLNTEAFEAKTNGVTTSVKQEAGSSTSSSSNSHSNSPVLNPTSSSSRRKAKTPRKIVIDP